MSHKFYDIYKHIDVFTFRKAACLLAGVEKTSDNEEFVNALFVQLKHDATNGDLPFTQKIVDRDDPKADMAALVDDPQRRNVLRLVHLIWDESKVTRKNLISWCKEKQIEPDFESLESCLAKNSSPYIKYKAINIFEFGLVACLLAGVEKPSDNEELVKAWLEQLKSDAENGMLEFKPEIKKDDHPEAELSNYIQVNKVRLTEGLINEWREKLRNNTEI
ncbi:MAG: hypothetical protein HQL55_20290, partial [Magnetococcales bacterium]|nr:hypothetical protein [Magnetococcales bacterium]